MQVLHYLHILSNNKNKKLITIVIDKANYEALRNLGHAGESFNTVLNRLINSARKHTPKNVKNEGDNQT